MSFYQYMFNGGSHQITSTVIGSGGVEIYGAPGTLHNSNAITGTLGAGVYLQVANGTIINDAIAYIGGLSRGVASNGYAFIRNYGGIDGGGMAADGVGISTTGGDVTNSGRIRGSADGIQSLGGFLNVSNDGGIYGGSLSGFDAIYSAGSLRVANSLTISSSYGNGIYAKGHALVTNTGYIYGGHAGPSPSGSPTDAIRLAGGGSVVNLAGGEISGFDAGVFLASGSVTNSGEIRSNISEAVYIAGALGGSVSNLSGGIILGFDGGIVMAGEGAVVNDGSIACLVGYSVDLSGGGRIMNAGVIGQHQDWRRLPHQRGHQHRNRDGL
jgi:hypothetical protein